MVWRILSFIACLLAGWLCGWYLAGDFGALAGAVLSPMGWVVVDTLRANRLSLWLRSNANGAPVGRPFGILPGSGRTGENAEQV